MGAMTGIEKALETTMDFVKNRKAFGQTIWDFQNTQFVLADLKAGNERFVAGELTPRDYLAQASATASGQYPKAVVLSCLDSRVPPEIIFDQGPKPDGWQTPPVK